MNLPLAPKFVKLETLSAPSGSGASAYFLSLLLRQ